jgi:hypothetical protein
MNTTTATAPSSSRRRTALSVVTAGIVGAAVLAGIAFAIDTTGGTSDAPKTAVGASAPNVGSGASLFANSAAELR